MRGFQFKAKSEATYVNCPSTSVSWTRWKEYKRGKTLCLCLKPKTYHPQVNTYKKILQEVVSDMSKVRGHQTCMVLSTSFYMDERGDQLVWITGTQANLANREKMKCGPNTVWKAWQGWYGLPCPFLNFISPGSWPKWVRKCNQVPGKDSMMLKNQCLLNMPTITT